MQFFEGIVIEYQVEAAPAWELEVVVAFGADFHRLFLVFFVDHFQASLAGHKKAVGHFLFGAEGEFLFPVFPTHGSGKMGNGWGSGVKAFRMGSGLIWQGNDAGQVNTGEKLEGSATAGGDVAEVFKTKFGSGCCSITTTYNGNVLAFIEKPIAHRTC